MNVIQVVKQLNNTELGKAGTHDSYVQVPRGLDVSDIFEETEVDLPFTDKNTMERVSIRKTEGRETRIVGLGPYYQRNELCAGDEILLERRTLSGRDSYWISVRKNSNSLILQKSQHGFEILTFERMENLLAEWKQLGIAIEIPFLTAQRKRYDSPNTTKYYDVVVNGRSLLSSVSGKNMVVLKAQGTKLTWTPSYIWKKYVFSTED